MKEIAAAFFVSSWETIQQWLLDTLPNLASALLILVGFLLILKVLTKGLNMAGNRAGMDQTAVAFIESVLRFVLMSVAIVSALNQLGINTVSIVTSLGVVGLTIGFAARDTLSNLISGFFIFWDRPFTLGDLVEISGQYGRVESITLRSTRIVTPDGKMLAVPNSTVVNTVVTSYTNFPHLRLDIDIAIGVEEDIDRVRALALELVRQDSDILAEPAPQVVLTALNDYNINLQMQCWLNDERAHVGKRLALRESIYKKLMVEGVDMPFETLQLRPLTVHSS